MAIVVSAANLIASWRAVGQEASPGQRSPKTIPVQCATKSQIGLTTSLTYATYVNNVQGGGPLSSFLVGSFTQSPTLRFLYALSSGGSTQGHVQFPVVLTMQGLAQDFRQIFCRARMHSSAFDSDVCVIHQREIIKCMAVGSAIGYLTSGDFSYS